MGKRGRVPCTMYLYTSSEMTSTRGWRRTTSAIASISPAEKTLPVGLCGELRTINLVRGPTAASSASASRRHCDSYETRPAFAVVISQS